MTKDTMTLVNELVLTDCQRITQRFIQEATAEWDKTGEGCFGLSVSAFVFMKWKELTRSN